MSVLKTRHVAAVERKTRYLAGEIERFARERNATKGGVRVTTHCRDAQMELQSLSTVVEVGSAAILEPSE